MSSPPQGQPKFTEPANDPWKGLRGVMAGTLILEVIVVLLAIPIVAKVGPGLNRWSLTFLIGLSAVMILASGMQGRPWALKLDLGLQAVTIAGGLFHWSIAAVGVVFGCVWIYIAYIKRDVEKRIARGELFGQEPIDT
ncbi:DUF4233 domain-containing protein [Gordonia sp. CPCC 205333]|uniref:DUF4233 domain-containing protein n=1 Tax=Gordonia sp. CPCC 205333 TaxID=3140790 RepID=UPI003AF367F2